MPPIPATRPSAPAPPTTPIAARTSIPTALVADWPSLWASLLFTLKVTFLALAAAIIGGGGLAILFAQSRWSARSLFPYAVILQVPPIVAISPLILIYVRDTTL